MKKWLQPSFMLYKSKDTPYSVAKKFNCAVEEDIFRENPGVSEKEFQSGLHNTHNGQRKRAPNQNRDRGG